MEVSVFGPGFGECVVVHLGEGDWGIIDSCQSPKTREPAAVDYLKSIGVNMATSVRLVVATHWHDDHIGGIGRIFEQSKGAAFACTEAVKDPEFHEILSAWTGTRLLTGGSGIDEMMTVLAEIKKRQANQHYPTPKLASANKILWERHGKTAASIRALSPSDAAIIATIARIKEIAPKFNKVRRRIPNVRDNDASVVLSVQAGNHHVLLGADLELWKDHGLGWMAIINGLSPGAPLHEGYKVAHHGSGNADNDDIWHKMLTAQPWAAITPFVQGSVKLPANSDCERILERTRMAYLTSPPKPVKYRDSNPTVEKTLNEAAISIHLMPGKFGHVRLRKHVEGAANTRWRVEMFGDALKIDDYLASRS